MNDPRPLFLFTGLSAVLMVSPACSKPTTPAPAQVVSTPTPAVGSADVVAPGDMKKRVQAAACTLLESTCKSKDTLFESRDWKRGATGFIALENEELDTALIAWTARGPSISVRLVAQAHDGSGAGIHNLVKVADVAIDDPEVGTISATVVLTSADSDPGACSTRIDREDHLVLCANVDEFLCGGLRVGVETAIESDTQCCKAESIPAEECPSTVGQWSRRSPVSFTDGSWSLGVHESGGVDLSAPTKEGPVELAAAGVYGVQAFLNTFTLSPDGIEL
ncbi:MAG: hypothetical protein KUG77_09505 [Nannocystaceae bacterium]|nr:hypothetical protein [Nannocystaceae bacterium]